MTTPRRISLLLIFALLSTAAITQTRQPIQPDFFGMNARQLNLSAPTVSFGAFRFWDTGTRWEQLEPTRGHFEWSRFDNWIDHITGDSQFTTNEALFVLGPGTPPWASSEPDDRKCDFYQEDHVPGQCYAPKDVAKDGSGSDRMWKHWVREVARHALASKIHIKYWEVWNVFNDDENTETGRFEWAGTPKQLERLAEDARCVITGRGSVQGVPCTATPIDASAIILSPSFASKYDDLHLKEAAKYFELPGAADAAEEIAFHNYTSTPEDTRSHIEAIKGALPQLDRHRPFFSTEGGWHDDCEVPDLDAQASIVARQFLMLNSNNVQAHYWYNWYARKAGGQKQGVGFGTLWNPDGMGQCTLQEAGLTPAGVAYQQIYNWMVGATVAACYPDHNVNTVYTCHFSRPNGFAAIAIWDSSQTCNNGCTTRDWTVPAGMKWYRDLAGDLAKIDGGTVKIGLKPLLLENENR